MDQRDCIVLIKELPQKRRQRGIKLYLLIANNILNNPNERKYRFLHYDKICKKFNKMEIFIELMIHSGFKKLIKPKAVLVFNLKCIQLLKDSMRALESIRQAKVDDLLIQHKTESNDKFYRKRLIEISNNRTQVMFVSSD